MKGIIPLFIGKGLARRHLNYIHTPFKGKNLAGPCPEKSTSHNTIKSDSENSLKSKDHIDTLYVLLMFTRLLVRIITAICHLCCKLRIRGKPNFQGLRGGGVLVVAAHTF